MELFTKDYLDSKNKFRSLKDGNLFWKKANHLETIQVPLSILTQEQISQLTNYLKSNDLNYNNFYTDNKSRLIWEYWWGTASEIIVDCIELNYYQKQKLSPKKQLILVKDDSRIKFEIGELVKFRNDYSSGKITWKVVLSKLSNLKGKAWTTKSWIARKQSLLKKSCESCGSSDSSLVLQHTRQPRKPETIMKQYKSFYNNDFYDWLKNHPVRIDFSAFPEDTPSCPKCNSQTIRFRKIKNSWICVSQIKGLKCGYEFEKPIYKISQYTINSLEKDAIDKKFKDFLESNGVVEKLITECFSDLFDYLNMTYSKTLCKKCAFLEDKHRI